MRLILLEDVEGLGRKGDVVDVADGYARNYLMPKRLGAKATAGALKDAERLRLAREEADRKAREEAEALSAALEGQKVVVAARSADEGRLFGSIGPRDVAEAIRRFTGVEIEHGDVDLRTPIKELGSYEIRVRPMAGIECHLTLEVIPA
jgi:large subunit ribosomal protein L9